MTHLSVRLVAVAFVLLACLTCVRRAVAQAVSGTPGAGSARMSLEHLPVRVEGSRLEIVHPASCRIERIDDEENRAASAAAYRIHAWPEAGPLTGALIQFHTLESIARFDARCLRSTGFIDDDSCCEGWRPHREDLERERLAILRASSAGACENRLGPGVLTRCAVVELGGKSMIARTRAFNWGAEREYVWFVGDVRASVTFLLGGDDPAVDPRADALVAAIGIQAEPER